MTTLIPTSSACHLLQLPPTEKDDRLNLNVRTGSASVLHNSFVFTYGGLTIGLELEDQVSAAEICATFLLRVASKKSRKVRKYLSGELFYLDLILKVWTRVDVPPGAPKPRPRLFHELAKGDGVIYVFGGLVIPDNVDELLHPCQLVPCNDLWEFNLTSRTWTQLHDGSDWELRSDVPLPRFCHKMTVVGSVPFAKEKDHSGLMIAGGLDHLSKPLYDNFVFDLVKKCYVSPDAPLVFLATTGDPAKDVEKGVSHFKSVNDKKLINVNYLDSIIVNFKEEVEYHHATQDPAVHPYNVMPQNKSIVEEESVIIYSPTNELEENVTVNPLLSFRLGKKFGRGKVLSLHKKRTKNAASKVLRHTIPLNLRYPTGGLFGQNLVITGFLPGDFDISIFIYNKPTGKWSRLNIFCVHDYGSHRFWGGFVWTSHHRVILLGNYVTSRTTSSVRYFSSMITVSLPVTNILASSELAGSHFHVADGKKYNVTETSSADEIVSASSSFSDDSTSLILQGSGENNHAGQNAVRKFSGFSANSDGNTTDHSVTFNDYVHYAAPKVNFTRVRSVFPPAAITLGRNALDRYGDLISDFELISCNGDRLPVSLAMLTERWGIYFIDILARAYVKAIDDFESLQGKAGSQQRLRSSKNSTGSAGSKSGKPSSLSGSEGPHSDGGFEDGDPKMPYQLSIQKSGQKDAPQFRLPFQDAAASSSTELTPQTASVDPHKQEAERKNSISSFSSGGSLLKSHLPEIPPQLPLPSEPIPAVPTTPISYRSSSRKNSTDALSPRASILHTLTALRNIPPNLSPFASPRGSVSMPHEPMTLLGKADQAKSIESPHIDSSESPSGTSGEPSRSTAEPENMSSRLDVGSPAASSGVKSTMSDSSGPTLSNDSSTSLGKEGENFEGHALLDFTTIDPTTFRMEPSLIPRKLYIPFGTSTLKAFCEYLYTGQVANKWTLKPCALDCMVIARYYKVPLLYDLLCEVLYGIIGRKEALVVKEGNKLKKKYAEIFSKVNAPLQSSFKSPLDEYEGFMDTVDDGYLDIALLRKSSSLHKASVSTLGSGKKRAPSSLGRSLSGDSTNTEAESYNERELSGAHDDPTSPKTKGEESPSSEEDANNSAEDETKFELSLHYLDFHEKKTYLGPRSKSVFDRSLYDSITPHTDQEDFEEEQERLADLTLEQLVSPDSPEPSSFVIDLIYETSSLCTDVKLMLRTMNVRNMVAALKQTQEDYERLSSSFRTYLDSQEGDESVDESETDNHHRESVSTVALGDLLTTPRPAALGKQQSFGESGGESGIGTRLEISRSTTSLATASLKSESLSRTTTGLKFTPFKNAKSETLDTNKELDRRIAQMIKQEEKLKQRQAKEERNKKHQLEKEKRKQSGVNADDNLDLVSLASKATYADDLLIYSGAPTKHRMLKRIGTKLKGETTPDTSLLARTKLSSSLSSFISTNRPVRKGLFGLRRK